MNTLTVHAERCVHQFVAQARCDACVQACPQAAWKINADGLSFDDAACDGCGLCVAACPCEALALPQATPLLRMTPAGKVILVACERADPAAFAAAQTHSTCQSGRTGQISPSRKFVAARLTRMDDLKPTAGMTPCLQALSPHWILHWAGPGAASRIRYSSGDCRNCTRGGGATWQERYAAVAASLRSAGRPVTQLERITFQEWQHETARDAAPDTRRRGLLRAMLQPAGAAATGARAPTATSGRTQLLQMLRARGVGRALWAVSLERERCNWCMACLRLCPDGALLFAQAPAVADTLPAISPARRDAVAWFTLDMQACTGCAVCVQACDRQALRLVAAPGPDQAVRTHVGLHRSLCTQCGASFHHLPRLARSASPAAGAVETAPEKPLCPACRQGRAPHHDRRVQAGEGT